MSFISVLFLRGGGTLAWVFLRSSQVMHEPFLDQGLGKKEMALFPHFLPAILNLLLRVWGQPPHVLDVTWGSSQSRPLPAEPKHPPAC